MSSARRRDSTGNVRSVSAQDMRRGANKWSYSAMVAVKNNLSRITLDFFKMRLVK